MIKLVNHMVLKTLSPPALKVINDYLHLPFSKDINCPYFNNKRVKIRGDLRVLIGKGSPEEIVAEAKTIARKEKIEWDALDEAGLKQFLVDHDLGVDCSALVYHILNAQINGGLKRLSFPHAKNPLRQRLARFRPAENTNVKTLAHEINSQKIEMKNIQPGDMIIMSGGGKKNDRDHVLLVHAVVYDSNHKLPTAIGYTHSFQWSTDGRYNHGVRQGEMKLIDANRSLTEQGWIEKGKAGRENETFRHAQSARALEIRRLHLL